VDRSEDPAHAERLFLNTRASEQAPGRVPGKAAGGPNRGAIGAEENAAGRRPGTAQPRSGGCEQALRLTRRRPPVTNGPLLGGLGLTACC
jgi:hypothetical protein